MNERQVALVIMESGARFPAGLAELQAQYAKAIVEAQPPGESAGEFTRRVVRRVRGLLDAGDRIDTIVLALASDADPGLLTPRYRMARASVAAMTRHGSGRLVLFAEETAPDELKHQMFGFAGALFDGLRGTRVAVDVRFSAPASRSGLHSFRADSAPELAGAG
ncbi:MAG: hypothetical protein KF718_06140 [Polyangiaceae bacterium]|nr:hypothetical protein [Polyangiaceae bacterium]